MTIGFLLHCSSLQKNFFGRRMWRRNIFFGEKDANIQKIFKDYFCIKSTLIKYQIDTFDTFVVTALAENITMIVTSWVPTDILTNPYWLDHYAGSHSTPLQPIMKYQEADHWKKIKKFIWAKYFFHFSLSLNFESPLVYNCC